MLLAIETSDLYGSIALLDEDRVLGEHFLKPPQRSAQGLAPAMAEILERRGLNPGQVDEVAIGIGPGSFTGLRVGIMTAKAFAYAIGAKIYDIGTLQAIAMNPLLDPTRVVDFLGKTVTVAVDAQRKEVSAQSFRILETGIPEPISEHQVLSQAEWWKTEADFFTGPILTKIADSAPAELREKLLEPEFWAPRAAAVGILAAKTRNFREPASPWSLEPIYARPSAAIERREAGNRSV